MKTLANTGRILAGLVFIFSGLSKGIDPEGSMYKFIDYFTAFGLDSLNNTALVLGILLCTAEFTIGFAAVAGIRMRLTAWGLLLFMLGFTPLTFVLALNNPVSDCGCFGDALHMSNWQTFYKNLVILLFVIPVFIYRKSFKAQGQKLSEWISYIVTGVLFTVFSILNYHYIPLIDFRPYAEGENLLENMRIPEGAEPDEYETLLIYEKDGVEEEFTIENYPSDTSWTFVDQKSTLIKKGYQPPIHDFILMSDDGYDYAEVMLSYPEYSIIMVSKDIMEVDFEVFEKGINTCEELYSGGLSSYLITSSFIDESLMMGKNTMVLSGDETTIKTIIRSNPGFLLIRDGTVLKKWSFHSMPDSEKILEKMDSYENRLTLNKYILLIIFMGIIVAGALLIRLLLTKMK